MDLGGGNSGQYFADKCRNDSASTLKKDKIQENQPEFEIIGYIPGRVCPSLSGIQKT